MLSESLSDFNSGLCDYELPPAAAVGRSNQLTIAERIRKGRHRKRISQRQLAALLGVAPSAVAQWELDQTLPTVERRADLARLLDIRFLDLVPEAEAVEELLLRDSEAVALARLFLKLPPQLRTAVLMHVAAIFDTLKGDRNSPTEDDLAPPPERGAQQA